MWRFPLKTPQISALFEKLVLHERRATFESLLQGKQLAIVGNAPTEVGSRRGQEIDSADLVVRFNRYSVSKEHAVDYGTRTDIWVTSISKEVAFNSNAAEWICCPFPITFKWLNRKGANRKAVVQALITGCIFPIKSEFERLIQDVPIPSTGISFLHFIAGCMSEPAQFKLYGFSFFNRNIPHHYFEKHTGNLAHDGDRERKYFEKKLINHCELRDTTTKPLRRDIGTGNTKRTK